MAIVISSIALTPALVAANQSAEQSFVIPALPAVLVGAGAAVVTVNKPTNNAGLGIVNARVIDATHLGITFGNFTAGGLTPTAAEVYAYRISNE